MSNIVERLRRDHTKVRVEAADEIERLWAENAKLRAALKVFADRNNWYWEGGVEAEHFMGEGCPWELASHALTPNGVER